MGISESRWKHRRMRRMYRALELRFNSRIRRAVLLNSPPTCGPYLAKEIRRPTGPTYVNHPQTRAMEQGEKRVGIFGILSGPDDMQRGNPPLKEPWGGKLRSWSGAQPQQITCIRRRDRAMKLRQKHPTGLEPAHPDPEHVVRARIKWPAGSLLGSDRFCF